MLTWVRLLPWFGDGHPNFSEGASWFLCDSVNPPGRLLRRGRRSAGKRSLPGKTRQGRRATGASLQWGCGKVFVGRFRDRYRVDSARLSGWDYRWAGWYFVTVCTQHKIRWFGRVVDGEMRLSKAGQIVAEELRHTEEVRANVNLNRWVIMPNHLHAVIVITTASSGSLGSIIGQFQVSLHKTHPRGGVP